MILIKVGCRNKEIKYLKRLQSFRSHIMIGDSDLLNLQDLVNLRIK